MMTPRRNPCRSVRRDKHTRRVRFLTPEDYCKLARVLDEAEVARRRATPRRDWCAGRRRFAGALRNLLKNAAACGGRATARTERDGAETRVVVDDEDPGIPKVALERVFEPFVRLEASRSRDTEGSGLGLAIARDGRAAGSGRERAGWNRRRPSGPTGRLRGIRVTLRASARGSRCCARLAFRPAAVAAAGTGASPAGATCGPSRAPSCTSVRTGHIRASRRQIAEGVPAGSPAGRADPAWTS